MAEGAANGNQRTGAPVHLRIFISSPGDVAEERRLAGRVIEGELAKDPLLQDRFTFTAVSWDDPDAPMTMTANLTPQEAVNRFGKKPSECDIVLVILWSRLGSNLDVTKFAKPNGEAYLSGTEWEYEDALAAKSQPDILVYRRTEKPRINDDPGKAQYALVNRFFERFRNPDGSFAGSVIDYAGPDAFGKRLGRDLKSVLKRRLDLDQPQTGGRLDGKIRVPRKPHLVGREGDLARVHEALTGGHAAITPALTGQGGIGKTQLAVLYAHEHAKDYPGGAFWLDAATPDRLIRGMSAYATELRLHDVAAEGDQEAFQRQSALRWIGEVRQRPDVLVVLDNVEDSSVLGGPILENTRMVDLGCRVLVTSRQRSLPGCADLPLDVLSLEDARALLFEESDRKPETGEERDAAGRVCRLLGRLPLAVRLAASRLRRSKGSLADYAAWLQQRGAMEVVDDRQASVDDYGKGLGIVLDETWQALPEDPPELKKVMLALGCLGEGESIPHRVLRHVLGLDPEPAPFGDPLEDAVEDLFRRSVLEQPTEESVRLHPLVHGIAARHGERFRDTFAETAAALFHAPEFWVGKRGEDILDVLADLSIMRPLTMGESRAARSLSLLERAIDLQSHILCAEFEPLPQLHRQALLLEDERLAQTLEEALAQNRRPWLRPAWTTHRLDPALRRVLEGHTGVVMGCALSGDGATAVSASQDRTLRVWDVGSGQCRAVLKGHTGEVIGCALSGDGATAISASVDKTLRVWDVVSGRCRAVLEGHTDWVYGCALSGDGATAVSASQDTTLRVWDVVSGRCRAVLEGHTERVNGCALSGDGATAVSVSDDTTLRVWDVGSGQCRAVLEGHMERVYGCALSGDGATAVSVSLDCTLRVWDVGSGQCRAVLKGHTGPVFGCALSGDGATAVSASQDKILRVWDVGSGRCRAVLVVEGIRCCAITSDGRKILAGDGAGHVHMFEWIEP